MTPARADCRHQQIHRPQSRRRVVECYRCTPAANHPVRLTLQQLTRAAHARWHQQQPAIRTAGTDCPFGLTTVPVHRWCCCHAVGQSQHQSFPVRPVDSHQYQTSAAGHHCQDLRLHHRRSGTEVHQALQSLTDRSTRTDHRCFRLHCHWRQRQSPVGSDRSPARHPGYEQTPDLVLYKAAHKRHTGLSPGRIRQRTGAAPAIRSDSRRFQNAAHSHDRSRCHVVSAIR